MITRDYYAMLQHFEIRESRLNCEIESLKKIIKDRDAEIKLLKKDIENLRADNKHKQEYINRLLNYNNLDSPDENKSKKFKNFLKKLFD